MKTLFFLFLSLTSQAGTLNIIGPCDKTPVIRHEFSIESEVSVGKLSVETFKSLNIPFIGSEIGMNSILDTPIGMDAMEVISDSEMMAYGWCYSVNGFEPSEYPNKIYVRKDDTVIWWFGYAHYKDGQWITQCTPSYERRSPQFCP